MTTILIASDPGASQFRLKHTIPVLVESIRNRLSAEVIDLVTNDNAVHTALLNSSITNWDSLMLAPESEILESIKSTQVIILNPHSAAFATPGNSPEGFLIMGINPNANTFCTRVHMSASDGIEGSGIEIMGLMLPPELGMTKVDPDLDSYIRTVNEASHAGIEIIDENEPVNKN